MPGPWQGGPAGCARAGSGPAPTTAESRASVHACICSRRSRAGSASGFHKHPVGVGYRFHMLTCSMRHACAHLRTPRISRPNRQILPPLLEREGVCTITTGTPCLRWFSQTYPGWQQELVSRGQGTCVGQQMSEVGLEPAGQCRADSHARQGWSSEAGW